MKIRLGLVVNDLTVGGVSAVVIELCNQFDTSIYDVHLIILSRNIKMLDIKPITTEVTKHYIDFKFDTNYDLKTYLLNSLFLTRSKKRAEDFLQLVKKLKLNILHFHTLPRQLVIGILARKQNPQIKLVFTDHLLRIGKDDYNFYQKKLLSFAYRILYRKYHLVAVSKSVGDYITKYKLSHSKKQFSVLENSINIENYLLEDKNEDNANVLVYVARLNHHKGQNTLIEAWQKLNKNINDKLYIVGPDESNGRIIELAKNDPTIIFTGSSTNVKSYLQKATIGVFPSQKEGLPIALLEMMAYALPIIVSDIPELTSVIRNKVEGYHFKLDDSDDLKLKIEALINDKQKIEKLGAKARKRVEEICILNEPIFFYDKFYRRIL